MARLWEWKVTLVGFEGAPGVNTFFTTVGLGAFDQSVLNSTNGLLHDAYSTLVPYFTGGIDCQGPSEVLEIDVETGLLQEVHSPSSVWGEPNLAGEDAMSRATAGKLQFTTDAIVGGRRVRGGPYIGPLGTNAIVSSGAISGGFRDAAQGAFDGLLDALQVGAARLVVYQRPRKDHPTLPDRGGSFGHVQSVDLWTKPAVMRSRRD